MPGAWVAGLLALALVLAPARPARAAEPTPQEGEAIAHARALSDRGRAAYEEGDYAESLASYAEAYAAVPLPAFLFNIAQAHRQLGSPALARLYYERYLSEAQPAGQQRMLVMELISEMNARESDAQVRGAVGLVQAGTQPRLGVAHPSGQFWQQWWFWAGVGVVVAGGSALALWSHQPDAPVPHPPRAGLAF